MKKIFILFLVALDTVYAFDLGVVHRPPPKPPHYLRDSSYPDLKEQFVLPPALNSAEQKKDENILFEFQKKRTAADCERAKSEIFISLRSFYGGGSSLLDDQTIEKLNPLFEQVKNDADYFIQKLKIDYQRKRPFAYISGLEPCISKEVTGAYPSGHATLAQLYSLVLSEFFPELKDQLQVRAEQIGQDRVIAGVHHPSDIQAGKKLASLIFKELQKSEAFKADLSKLNH